MGQDERHLDPLEVQGLLEKLLDAKEDIVLIGGQALNFWAGERYASVAELSADAPYTSTDIDFYGGTDQVVRCAKLVGGTPSVYGPRHATVSAGSITTPDGIQIDFVHTPKGVSPPKEILAKSISFPRFRVMHPIHVLKSRAANVLHIPRTDDHSLKQLRASVYVVREFIRQDVLAAGMIKKARHLNEQAFDVAKSEDGLAVWRRYAIDMFKAVLCSPAFGEKFAAQRYPQMCNELERLRR